MVACGPGIFEPKWLRMATTKTGSGGDENDTKDDNDSKADDCADGDEDDDEDDNKQG